MRWLYPSVCLAVGQSVCSLFIACFFPRAVWGSSRLPVWGCVDYKLALLVYKSLHGLAPSYHADDCILASSDKFRRRLHSADVDTCIVPRTRTRFGDRSCPAAGPRIWNSLPPELRRPDTELGEFRRHFCLRRISRDGGALVTP